MYIPRVIFNRPLMFTRTLHLLNKILLQLVVPHKNISYYNQQVFKNNTILGSRRLSTRMYFTEICSLDYVQNTTYEGLRTHNTINVVKVRARSFHIF